MELGTAIAIIPAFFFVEMMSYFLLHIFWPPKEFIT